MLTIYTLSVIISLIITILLNFNTVKSIYKKQTINNIDKNEFLVFLICSFVPIVNISIIIIDTTIFAWIYTVNKISSLGEYSLFSKNT